MPSLTQRVIPFTATAAEWTFANDILAGNELGIESDTGRMKQGDGATRWNDLAYMDPDADNEPDVSTDVTYYIVEDEAERLALDVKLGDEAEQLDNGTVYKYIQTASSQPVEESEDSGSGSEESGSGSESAETEFVAGWVVLYEPPAESEE